MAGIVTYDVSKASNPAYKTIIRVPDAGLEVVTDTPEQLAYAVSSTWEARLPGLMQRLQGMRDGAAGVLGLGMIHKEETRQIWQGTTPLEISLTLLFDAKYSAQKDVYEPIMALVGMALPEEVNNILLPPGPSRLTKRNAITVIIGRYFRMEDGLMTSVQPTFDTRLASDGYPIAGQAEITIRASITYTRADYIRLNMLPPGAFGQGGSTTGTLGR